MHANTDAAVAEIDDLRARHPRWRDVAVHADALTVSGRPLARILLRPEFGETIRAYEAASKAAQEAQTRQRSLGASAAWLGFAATTISAVLLFLQWESATLGGAALNGVHFLCLAAALSSALVLRLRRPSTAWATARASSERTRLEHFDAILEASRGADAPQPNAVPVRALALEYMRAFLMEDQRDWHSKRGMDFNWLSRWIAFLRWLGIVLLLAAMTSVVASLLQATVVAAHAPDLAKWAGVAKSWIGSERSALVGVLGGALQTLSTSLGALSLAERNRRSFARLARVLDGYLGTPLSAARVAAVDGDDRAVDRFWWAVRTELVAENRAWTEVIDLSSATLLEDFSKAAGKR